MLDKKLRTRCARGLEFGPDHRLGTNGIIRNARGARHLGQRGQRILRSAMFGQQSFIRGYADPARAQQTETGELFIFRGGWEWGVNGRRI